MSGTIIANCVCSNDFQDRQYGKGRRVANLTKKEDRAHCTVCGRELASGKAALADKKKADKEVEKAKEDAATKKVSK